jgi:hypothetical protein
MVETILKTTVIEGNKRSLADLLHRQASISEIQTVLEPRSPVPERC